MRRVTPRPSEEPTCQLTHEVPQHQYCYRRFFGTYLRQMGPGDGISPRQKWPDGGHVGIASPYAPRSGVKRLDKQFEGPPGSAYQCEFFLQSLPSLPLNFLKLMKIGKQILLSEAREEISLGGLVQPLNSVDDLSFFHGRVDLFKIVGPSDRNL